MKKNSWKIFGILFILSLGALLYFYKLGKIPSGVYVDEASPIYNAFSILTTGKDEYGFAFPIYFRQLGSYSPGLFIYLAAILLKFFGTDIAVFRAISGVGVLLTVLIFYLLTKKMKLYKLEVVYFAATLFYAILPWNVFNARLGYETTLGFVIFSLGAYFLYLALTKPPKLLPAIGLLSLSTYASHNERFLAPLFLLVFAVLFRKDLIKKENTSILVSALIFGILINIPNILMLGTSAFWIKSSQFNPHGIGMAITTLSPKTLFWQSPDIDMQHTIPKLSMFYWPLVFPWFIGLYEVVKHLKKTSHTFLVFYSVIVLLPGVFSGYFFSSQRSYVAVIPLMAIVGLGLEKIFEVLPKSIRLVGTLAVACYCLLLVYSSYFVLLPVERAQGWDYGWDQVASYISDHPEEKILVDDTRNPRAYILLMYYLRVPPAEYQAQVDPFYKENYYLAPPPAEEYTFGKVVVRQLSWEDDPNQELTIIGDPLTISDSQAEEHGLVKVSRVLGPDGNPLFNIYKTTPSLE